MSRAKRVIKIYTDGSCKNNPGAGGWASVIFLSEDYEVLKGWETATTNNRMELMAIVKSLEFCVKNKSKARFIIHSDSAYCINAITKGWLKKWSFNLWKTNSDEDIKNKDLWIEVYELLTTGVNVEFKKVKGHAGILGNELANKFANEQALHALKVGV